MQSGNVFTLSYLAYLGQFDIPYRLYLIVYPNTIILKLKSITSLKLQFIKRSTAFKHSGFYPSTYIAASTSSKIPKITKLAFTLF